MSEIALYWVKVPDVVDMRKLDARVDILDEEERGVYQRYRVDFKKVEFLIGRLLLKTQLGARLQVDPHLIHFAKGQFGKLLLANHYYEAAGQHVYFNLSHTDKMIVCGFTTRGELGVDVEYTEKDHLSVMPTVYLPHEIASVDEKQTQAEKFLAFYQLWTRKEAYIKALGTGFSLSPLTFSVPLEPGRVIQQEWEYYTFQPQPSYMISTAIVKEPEEQITYQIQELGFDELLQTGITTPN